MIKKFQNYLFEFKSEDIKLVLTGLVDYFTIGFEIEIETSKERVKGLKDVPRYESVMMYPSRQNRKMMEDFKFCFPNFYQKYKNRISFHDDETVLYGVEIVNSVPSGMKNFPSETLKPFDNVKDAMEYMDIFFKDFKNQKHWKFSHRTSIHINIGTRDNSPINMTKGIIMISDEEKSGFVFKGIDDRITSYCGSIKQKLIDMFKKKPIYKLLYSNNIKEIENIIQKKTIDLYDFYGGLKSEMACAKSFGIIFKKNYVEFRYVGGENVDEKIMREKLLYFCYLVYLMTSEYRNKEYVRKLFSFINKLK